MKGSAFNLALIKKLPTQIHNICVEKGGASQSQTLNTIDVYTSVEMGQMSSMSKILHKCI